MKPWKMPVNPLKNRISTFSVERGQVEMEGGSLVVKDQRGTRCQIPVGSLAALILEPGSTISHAAIKTCSEHKTLVLWTGEGGIRLYSAGQEGAAHSYKLLRQARLALNPSSRLAVARAMYDFRFDKPAPRRRNIEQIRGMEGARVKEQYRRLSEIYGVEWNGRKFDRSNWDAGDTINKVISAANSCLYGLCHAAILIAGYSPAIGFIHTGYPLAFVHDIADLWKMELSVATSFQVVSEGVSNPVRQVRLVLRDKFREANFLEKVIPTIEEILNAGLKGTEEPEELGGTRLEERQPENAPWYQPGQAERGGGEI